MDNAKAKILLSLAAVVLFSALSVAEDHSAWPRFRGHSGLGIAAPADYPVEWNGPAGRGIIWKSDVPLHGENSPIVWDNRIFITGADADNREVFCYDASTGELLWRQAVAIDVDSPEVWDETGYAASSAATDGQRVYAIFATGDIAAFDFDGNPAWTHSLGVPENPYGHASSLEIWKNLLLVQFDQGYDPDDGNSVLYALDSATGSTVWSLRRDVKASWATPAVFSTLQGDQLVTAAAPLVIAYDPATGSELWRADCMSGDVAPSPIYADGIVYVCQEYARAVAISADGNGDITDTHIRWSAYQGLPDIVTPLTDGVLLYLVNTYGIVTCYDAENGKVLWEHDLRTELNASPVLAGDAIYLLAKDGIMHVFQNDREYREIERSSLGEPASATPAFVNGRIYIRGRSNLYCIGYDH